MPRKGQQKNPIMDGKKNCSKCNTVKSLEQFNILTTTVDGYNTRCRNCLRDYKQAHYSSPEKANKLKLSRQDYKRKNRYNFSTEEFEIQLIKQNYCCSICNLHFDNKAHKTKPFIDHCHTTEKIRGLLCNNCNFALGGFKDNEDFLLSAIQYLRKSL